MNVVAKRYDEYAKMARQAAYGLPPEEAVKKIMGLASSGIPEFVLMSEAKKILESSKPPAQAPQSTVKDKILAAAAPQQAMPQGMPQGMPQPGVPPQEMPQQAMPPMPEGLPPMPPQGMAEGGSVNDYGVASLPGERGDEYAIDQGLGSLSADIDYAGGGIVSFAEGGESPARRILEKGLAGEDEEEPVDEYHRAMAEGAPERDYFLFDPLKYAVTQPFRNANDIARLPFTALEAASWVRDPETGKLVRRGSQEDFSWTPTSDRGYQDYFGEQAANTEALNKVRRERMGDQALPEPPLSAAQKEMLSDVDKPPLNSKEFSSAYRGPQRVSAGLGGRKSVSLSRLGLESLAPVTIPRIKDEDFPAAPQIQKTPEFDKDKRFKEQEELNTLYGVDPNYFNSRQEELQKERDALSGRVPQEAWASLGARGMEAFKARPGEAPPTLLGGIGNLFGLMTQDLQKTNADIRQEKLALRREENTLRQADRAERMGNAEEAQRLRDSVEAKRLQEENAQREIDYNRATALFEADAARGAEERKANLERELASMEARNRFEIARVGAKGSETLFKAALKELGLPASEINKLQEDINNDPNVDVMVEAELNKQGYGDGFFQDEASPEQKAAVRASIVDALMAQQVQRIMEVQNASVARMSSLIGPSSDGYTVEEN